MGPWDVVAWTYNLYNAASIENCQRNWCKLGAGNGAEHHQAPLARCPEWGSLACMAAPISSAGATAACATTWACGTTTPVAASGWPWSPEATGGSLNRGPGTVDLFSWANVLHRRLNVNYGPWILNLDPWTLTSSTNQWTFWGSRRKSVRRLGGQKRPPWTLNLNPLAKLQQEKKIKKS